MFNLINNPQAKKIGVRAASANRAMAQDKNLPMRRLKLHEYQAANLLKSYDVPVPLGQVAFTPLEALGAARSFNHPVGSRYVVKSQVLGGGRGLGSFKETGFKGGVHLVQMDDVESIANEMIGKTLVTKQSGEAGLPCNCVYIVETLDIAKEIYLSVTLDRAAGKPVIIYSPAGGMSIEDVAHDTPDKIFKIWVDPLKGLQESDLDGVAKNMDIPEQDANVRKMLKNLYKCFIERDADLVEINPLVTTRHHELIAADSKVTVDDNAAFRQKELVDQEDKSQKNDKEKIAHEHDLNYIHIGGNIGCLVNGAGLAMSTMDILSLHGGQPANFLDVGGSADGP